MARRLLTAIAATLAASVLAGCGDSKSGSAAPVAAVTGEGAGNDWAVDACKTFPVAVAAKASGLAVETATLGAQVSVGGTNASSCSYSTAGNRETFGVLLRHDTTGNSTLDGQLASVTGNPAETGPSEMVAMPKGKAVWQPQLRSLSYLPDDGRMIVVTPPFIGLSMQGTDPAKMKDAAIRIAIAAGA